eukprot:Colp12_sorted_trinity150504_noHs@2492
MTRVLGQLFSKRAWRTIGVLAVGSGLIEGVVHYTPGSLVKPLLLNEAQQKKLEDLKDRARHFARLLNVPNPEKIDVNIRGGASSQMYGDPRLPNGATIYVPLSMLSEGVDKTKNLILYGKQTEWESEVGQLIQRLWVPSPAEVDFVIAHETAHIQHKHVMHSAVFAPVSLLFSMQLAHLGYGLLFRGKVDSALGHKYMRGFFTAMGLLVYAGLRGSLWRRQEYEADATAALLVRLLRKVPGSTLKRGEQLSWL